VFVGFVRHGLAPLLDERLWDFILGLLGHQQGRSPRGLHFSWIRQNL
jgi:hypothetical protein